jgi:hypothetical protein
MEQNTKYEKRLSSLEDVIMNTNITSIIDRIEQVCPLTKIHADIVINESSKE